MWCWVISPSFLFLQLRIVTLHVVVIFLVFAFYICCFVTVNTCLWFSFAVLQVSCENKSNRRTTHSTQFMIHTEEGSVLHLYTKFQADSSFRSKVIRGCQNFEIGSRDPGHAHLGVVLYSERRRGPSSISVQNLKRIALFVQKLLGVPKFRVWITLP